MQKIIAIQEQIVSGINNETKLVNSCELRYILNISDSTLKRLRKDPQFPAYRTGWEFRYDPQEVKEYLRKLASVKAVPRNSNLTTTAVKNS